MPSNITAIRHAIAAAYSVDVPELKLVLPYLPAALGETPAHIFWQAGSQVLHATQGGMRIGWTLTGYVCMLPLGEAETERQLTAIVAKMYDCLHRNLEASGTIGDGTVTLTASDRFVLTLAGTPFQAQRVTYFVEESFSYAYGRTGEAEV